jgi:hypothetical protein
MDAVGNNDGYPPRVRLNNECLRHKPYGHALWHSLELQVPLSAHVPSQPINPWAAMDTMSLLETHFMTLLSVNTTVVNSTRQLHLQGCAPVHKARRRGDASGGVHNAHLHPVHTLRMRFKSALRRSEWQPHRIHQSLQGKHFTPACLVPKHAHLGCI